MGYVDLNQNKRTDWITPPDCRELLAKMGPLKLDVCTVVENPMGAEQIYTPEVDGLQQSWDCGGLAWCNFPWSRTDTPKWVTKACEEGDKINANSFCVHCGDPAEGHVQLLKGLNMCKTKGSQALFGAIPAYTPQGRPDSELVLLGPARPDTAWFRRLWGSANVIYFYKGRMTFINPDSGLPCLSYSKKSKRWEKQPVPVPLLLAYWGNQDAKFVEAFAPQGGVFAYPGNRHG